MINPLQAIINYNGDEWEEYLDSISLIEIFKGLISRFGDNKPLLKGVMQYIVWAYSKNSEKVTLGTDWLDTKKRIYEASMLPPKEDIYEAVVNLKDEAVLFTIKRWIDFQNDDAWREFKMLKDLRAEMQLSANSQLTVSGSNAINYDQKFKNAKYSIELTTMIKECEQRLIQADARFKDAAQEIKNRTKNNISLSPETFAK